MACWSKMRNHNRRKRITPSPAIEAREIEPQAWRSMQERAPCSVITERETEQLKREKVRERLKLNAREREREDSEAINAREIEIENEKSEINEIENEWERGLRCNRMRERSPDTSATAKRTQIRTRVLFRRGYMIFLSQFLQNCHRQVPPMSRPCPMQLLIFF